MASVSAAARDHQPVGTGDEVALADCRVVLDADGREPELVLAVAGAAVDDFVAIAKRIRQFGIGFAGLGRGVVDIAAIDHLGLAGRTEAVAGGRAALAIGGGEREVAPVAGPYAERRAAAIGAQTWDVVWRKGDGVAAGSIGRRLTG